MKTDKQISLQEAYRLAAEDLNLISLVSNISQYNKYVIVHHEDGSFFYFCNAFSKRKIYGTHKFFLVWTEHNSDYIFHIDDLQSFKQSKM